MNNILSFDSKILINGVNPYVKVLPEQAVSLKQNWRRPMPVIVRINEKPENGWRINMMPMGDGSFYLYLSGEVRKASGTKVDDIVNVQVEFDDEYKNGPLHAVPSLLQNALNQNDDMRNRWHELSPSRQKEVLRYIDNIKSEEIKAKNIERLLRILSGESDHFMGRDWINGK